VIDVSGSLEALQRQIGLDHLRERRPVLLTSQRLTGRHEEPDQRQNQHEGEAPREDLAAESLDDT
jgi:hypothetical protein